MGVNRRDRKIIGEAAGESGNNRVGGAVESGGIGIDAALSSVSNIIAINIALRAGIPSQLHSLRIRWRPLNLKRERGRQRSCVRGFVGKLAFLGFGIDG